jgi:hypothetical protein
MIIIQTKVAASIKASVTNNWAYYTTILILQCIVDKATYNRVFKNLLRVSINLPTQWTSANETLLKFLTSSSNGTHINKKRQDE